MQFLLHLLLHSHMGNKRSFLDWIKSVLYPDGSVSNPWLCSKDRLEALAHVYISSRASSSFGARLQKTKHSRVSSQLMIRNAWRNRTGQNTVLWRRDEREQEERERRREECSRLSDNNPLHFNQMLCFISLEIFFFTKCSKGGSLYLKNCYYLEGVSCAFGSTNSVQRKAHVVVQLGDSARVV